MDSSRLLRYLIFQFWRQLEFCCKRFGFEVSLCSYYVCTLFIARRDEGLGLLFIVFVVRVVILRCRLGPASVRCIHSDVCYDLNCSVRRSWRQNASMSSVSISHTFFRVRSFHYWCLRFRRHKTMTWRRQSCLQDTEHQSLQWMIWVSCIEFLTPLIVDIANRLNTVGPAYYSWHENTL